MPQVAGPMRHQLDTVMDILQPHPPHDGKAACATCNAVAQLRFIKENFGDLTAKQEHAMHALVHALWEFPLDDTFSLRVALTAWRAEEVTVPRAFNHENKLTGLLSALRDARDCLRPL